MVQQRSAYALTSSTLGSMEISSGGGIGMPNIEAVVKLRAGILAVELSNVSLVGPPASVVATPRARPPVALYANLGYQEIARRQSFRVLRVTYQYRRV